MEEDWISPFFLLVTLECMPQVKFRQSTKIQQNEDCVLFFRIYTVNLIVKYYTV